MAEKLVIRTAHIEDSESIMTLMAEFAAYVDMTEKLVSTKESIEDQVFKEGRAKALIAEVDGYPIGYASITIHSPHLLEQKAYS